MFTTAAGASGPKTRKAGTATAPTSHNFIHNSERDLTPQTIQAQRLTLAPRIIATHWLRLESMEVANG